MVKANGRLGSMVTQKDVLGVRVHIAIDTSSQQILSVVVSTNDFTDNEVVEDLYDKIEQPIDLFYGDRAYDAQNI